MQYTCSTGAESRKTMLSSALGCWFRQIPTSSPPRFDAGDPRLHEPSQNHPTPLTSHSSPSYSAWARRPTARSPLPLCAGSHVGAPISEWARPPAAQHAHVSFPQLLGPLPLLGPRRAPRSRPRSEPSNLHPTVQVQPARSQKNSENGQRRPFCKRVPAVFQNQPAVHHKSKLITLRPSF